MSTFHVKRGFSFPRWTHFTVQVIVVPVSGGLVKVLHHLVIFKQENVPTIIITFVTVEFE